MNGAPCLSHFCVGLEPSAERACKSTGDHALRSCCGIAARSCSAASDQASPALISRSGFVLWAVEHFIDGHRNLLKGAIAAMAFRHLAELPQGRFNFTGPGGFFEAVSHGAQQADLWNESDVDHRLHACHTFEDRCKCGRVVGQRYSQQGAAQRFERQAFVEFRGTFWIDWPTELFDAETDEINRLIVGQREDFLQRFKLIRPGPEQLQLAHFCNNRVEHALLVVHVHPPTNCISLTKATSVSLPMTTSSSSVSA